MSASVKKILVVRMSAMGDIVMASPILQSLKSLYPDAKISWAVQPEFADVLQGHDLLDEIIVVPKGKWKKAFKTFQWWSLWQEIRAFKRDIRAKKFDLAIDLQGLAKSGAIVKWSEARRKFGLNSREGSQRWMDKVVDGNAVDGELISSEYQAMAQFLGDMRLDFSMNLPSKLNTPNWENIQSLLGENYMVFCPFTTRPQKHWFNKSWQQLAKILPLGAQVPAGEKESFKIAVLGGPGDIEAAEDLMQSMPENVVNLVGKTSIQEAIAVIRHSSGVIGVDTGLTHMGIAENKPTLALFGSTLPYSDTRSGKSKVLYQKMDCSPCRRNPTCEGRFDCMQSLTPELVANEWLKLQ